MKARLMRYPQRLHSDEMIVVTSERLDTFERADLSMAHLISSRYLSAASDFCRAGLRRSLKLSQVCFEAPSWLPWILHLPFVRPT